MSDEKKYLELLKEIGRIIKEKNDEIIINDFRLSDLKKKLENAEKEIEELRKETKNNAIYSNN